MFLYPRYSLILIEYAQAENRLAAIACVCGNDYASNPRNLGFARIKSILLDLTLTYPRQSDYVLETAGKLNFVALTIVLSITALVASNGNQDIVI